MKSKFFRKFFFTTVLLILVSLAIIMYLVSYFVTDYLLNEKKTTLYDNCHSIALVSANNNDGDMRVVVDSMHALAASNGNTIFAVNSDGILIGCGCEEWFVNQKCVHSGIKIDEKILKISLFGHYNDIGNLHGEISEKYIVSAIPLQNKFGATVGSIFSCAPISYINNLFADLANIFLFSAIIPIIALFIVEYIISYKFTKPLKLMSAAAKLMSEGDFSTKIPVNSRDEIGELSKSFNEMSEAIALNENIRKDFVANVSHELRTPMTNIGGFIDGILDGTIPNDSSKKYLEIVSSEIRRLTRIVSSMFELSKIESGEKELELTTFDFNNVLIDTFISKESDISKKALTVYGVDELKEINIYADKGLFHQVLYNLVDNAVKFNKENGYIKVQSFVQNGNLIFKIANSGYTIQNEDLPYIFDRFYKGDKARSNVKDSTGLGLHLVKTVLDIHGGGISAKSFYNEYTEFTVTLPLVKE